MGFVSIANVLAWPVLALVYPLCASIRIIESDSSSDPRRKLVAYWIIFSLIILFEHAFAKLLEWVPFWPYIKLIISFLLVIPNFDGASYVYEHFLRPCLCMDSKLLGNHFKETQEFVIERNNLATEVQRHAKENRPETLEVASKVKVQSANNFVEKDEKTIEVTEKKDMGAVKQVSETEPGLSQIENKELVPGESKEISETLEAFKDICRMPFPMRVQREWTCAMCQVTTQSETTLNSHLQGRRHRVRCKELKGKNNQPVKTKSSAAQHKKSDKTVQESGDSVAMSGRSKRHKKMQCQPGNVKHVERKQSLWWCTICNRSCNSVHDMECHLNGRKHLAQVEQLKASS